MKTLQTSQLFFHRKLYTILHNFFQPLQCYTTLDTLQKKKNFTPFNKTIQNSTTLYNTFCKTKLTTLYHKLFTSLPNLQNFTTLHTTFLQNITQLVHSFRKFYTVLHNSSTLSTQTPTFYHILYDFTQ